LNLKNLWTRIKADKRGLKQKIKKSFNRGGRGGCREFSIGAAFNLLLFSIASCRHSGLDPECRL
jgi:hypothetical protein